MKVCAVTAALVCAGGGAIIGHGSASGANPPPPASLDHYLCVGDLGAPCVPAKTTMPDGTTFEVSNPLDRLFCSRRYDSPHGHGPRDTTPPTTVIVSNELSPTPVSLAEGRQQLTCSVASTHHSSEHRQDEQFSHSHANLDPVATFSCSSVQYPANSSDRFGSPLPLKIGDHLSVQVLDPAQLCVPAGAPTAGGATDSLLCFRVRVALWPHRFFAPVLTLCVPSSLGGNPPTTPTSTTAGTTTTAASTTTTTTTTQPGSPTTTTTTADTTTTTASTTTSTTTTTTTGPPTQPCAGVIINGVCIITV